MTESPKRVVILGATSAIAQAAARIWAAQGARFVLVARNAERLEAIAADLKARGAAQAEILVADCAEVEPTAELSADRRDPRRARRRAACLRDPGRPGAARARSDRDRRPAANQFHQRRSMVPGGRHGSGAPALRRSLGDRFGGRRSRARLELRLWRLQGGSRRARRRASRTGWPRREAALS